MCKLGVECAAGCIRSPCARFQGVLEHFLRVFWACFRSLMALSGTWVPAVFSGVREKALLLLCRLPLLRACSRRCGSCRRPALAFLAASALARLRLFLSAPPWRLLVLISYVMHAVRRLVSMCFLVPVLLHPASFRRPIPPWLSFSGRRCSGPVPGAAAVASFLPSMFFFWRRVWRFGSSRLGVASCLRAHVYCHQYLSIFPVLLLVRSRPFSAIFSFASPVLAAVAWSLRQVPRPLPAIYSVRLLFLSVLPFSAALCVQAAARMVVLHLPCASDPAASPGRASLFVRVSSASVCPSLPLPLPLPLSLSLAHLFGSVALSFLFSSGATWLH